MKPDSIKSIYVSGMSCILHAVVVPLFAYVFVIIYQPFNMNGYLEIGTLPFIAHLSILFSILLATFAITRTLLYFFGEKLIVGKRVYALWCLGEVLLSGLFSALYIALMMQNESSFFEVARIALGIMFCISIFPYGFLFLGLDTYMRIKEAESKKEEDNSSLIRFYDEYRKLKFIIASEAVVFIKSEDNYVQIYYMDQQKMKKQILRSSMRALEDVLSKHGLVRCHRSYFINPDYIRMLHKDTSGTLVAELSQEGGEAIPVSRKYQEEITKLL